MMSPAPRRLVSRNEDTPGGTRSAISAITCSAITPGPLGIDETNPSADTPARTASAASSILLMQQIFTRGCSGESMYLSFLARYLQYCWLLWHSARLVAPVLQTMNSGARAK